jgi:HK97 family phage portal protein
MNLKFWQPKRTEKRSGLAQPTDWLINTLQNVFGYQTKSGQAVNDRTALSIASVHACVRVIADGIAGLSLKLYKDDGQNREQVVVHYATALVNEPNAYQTKYDFTKYMVSHLALKGNAYAFINRDSRYLGIELHPIAPDYVQPIMQDGQLFYKVNRKGFPGMIPAADMLHFKGLCGDDPLVGLSPIVVIWQQLARAQASIKMGC